MIALVAAIQVQRLNAAIVHHFCRNVYHAASRAVGQTALDNDHHGLQPIALTQYRTGLGAGPGALGGQVYAVHNQGGMELAGRPGCLRPPRPWSLQCTFFHRPEAPNAYRRAGPGGCPFLRPAYREAGDLAAVAGAVVHKGAAGDGEQAVMIVADFTGGLTGDRQGAGGAEAQPGGVLEDRHYAPGGTEVYPQQQNAVLGVQSQYLIAGWF